MLNDGTGFKKVYLACGFTDLRRGIDGLARSNLQSPIQTGSASAADYDFLSFDQRWIRHLLNAETH